MTAVVNPTTITVGDSKAAANGVTSFKILVGTQSGGPYAAAVADVPLSAMTLSGTAYSVPLAQVTFSPALQPGVTYFAVAEEQNAGGDSGNSPEATFQIVPAATPPESLSFS